MILKVALLSLLLHHITPICLDISTFVVDKRYLRYNLIGVTTVSSLVDCAVYCQSHYGCISFGFKPRTQACHLHTRDSFAVPADLVHRTHWIHVDIQSLPTELWGPCADHNCSNGQQCSVHRVTKQSYCRKADLDLPYDHCPALDVTNAVSSGGQEIGSSRNYTCLEGYLDTESFLTSAVTTCLSDNTWSPLSLACTGPFVKITQCFQFSNNFGMIEENTFRNITGNTSSLVFWVKTCRDSNFALCETSNLNDCYEIVIGGYSNSKSEIRWQSYRHILVAKSEEDILSCTEFRPFWISWQNGMVSVGRGEAVDSLVFFETEMLHLTDIKSVWYSCHLQNEAVWFFLQR